MISLKYVYFNTITVVKFRYLLYIGIHIILYSAICPCVWKNIRCEFAFSPFLNLHQIHKQHFIFHPTPSESIFPACVQFFPLCIAVCCAVMDDPDSRSMCWQGNEGKKQDKPFGWCLFDFRGISIQDNKSSECTFNPESMYTTWRICIFFGSDLLFKCSRPGRADTLLYFLLNQGVKKVKQHISLN